MSSSSRSGSSESGRSVSDDDACCELCEQKFNEQDEDAPLGYVLKVVRVKRGRNVCKECHYVHRGSFCGKGNEETSKLDGMKTKMKEVPPVKSKFKNLRKTKVHYRCKNPGRRPRHTKVDVPDLIRRAEEAYVDIQSANHGNA